MSTLISNNNISEKDLLESPIRISALELTADKQYLRIMLNTGDWLELPLSDYPRLLKAAVHSIYAYKFIGRGMGLSWPDLDEDLSLKGFLEDAQVDYPALKAKAEQELLNKHAAKHAAEILRAVNHSLRQRIIAILRLHPGITVTEIYKQLQLEQSVTSQHLAILKHAGIVLPKREGKNIRYSLNYERLEAVSEAVNILAA